MTQDIQIEDLNVYFETASGPVYAVKNLSTTFHAGKISGVIGESGSGKSVMGMSILRLLPNTARVTGKRFSADQELYTLPLRQLRKLRGKQIGLIPQNPNASLDPVMKVKRQFVEAVTAHTSLSRRNAAQDAGALLEQFGFTDAGAILDRYSFQMSGGMNQRLVSALGLINQPGWVIADEPTKGLDAPLRNQVYRVLRQIYRKNHSSMILITHDLLLARQLCDDIRVMYQGQIVEQGDARAVIDAPKHPYTAGLVGSLPSRGMHPIPLPDPKCEGHSGCPFYPRCEKATAGCAEHPPGEVTLPDGRKVRCRLYG